MKQLKVESVEWKRKYEELVASHAERVIASPITKRARRTSRLSALGDKVRWRADCVWRTRDIVSL
jgi:hypothetical protein